MLFVALLSTTSLSVAQANEPPRVHEIKSVLAAPFSYYSVQALDPELADLKYSWTLTNAGRCTDFASEGATATWRHDSADCPHDAPAHPGTITVVVSDGANSVTRMYTGGSAPHDPGEPDWRVAGTTFFGGNEEGDDPRDFPPPAIYGEELDCPAVAVAGAFEPVQAVWQDENSDLFPDLSTKRILTLTPTQLTAELQLVVGKHAQLFGLRNDRRHIYYNGSVTGTDLVPAVVRWTIRDGAGERVLGEIATDDMPLGGGDCGSPTPFRFAFDTSLGLEIRHFLPKEAGDYTIVMELAERGGAAVPGSAVTLSGKARVVHEPRIYFVPVVMRDNVSSAEDLTAVTRVIAADSALNIPDYYPLPPAGITAIVRPEARDMRRVTADAQTTCDQHPGLSNFSWCFVNAVRSGVESALSGSSWIIRTRGAQAVSVDRVAAIVTQADMDELLYPPAGSAAGFAANTKTFFIYEYGTHSTVAHELAHTTPAYAWLHEQPDCTVDYHNVGGSLGHGFQTTVGGQPSRVWRGPEGGMMSSSSPYAWIEQCSYWHLLHHLSALEDPLLVGIRGWIAKEGGFETGAFQPGMTFEGITEREPGGTGPYAVRLLDASGRELAVHRFDHPFEDDWGGARPMIAFTMAVERPDALARIELIGPTGTLATREVTRNAPTLTLAEPAAGASPTAGRPLRVSWTATDADCDASADASGSSAAACVEDTLTYGVAFSADDGATWYDVDFDLNVTEVEVPASFIAAGSAYIVRVMATDGVNSVEVERALGSRPPAVSPTSPTGGASPSPDERDDAPAPSPGLGAVGIVLALALAVALARRRRR